MTIAIPSVLRGLILISGWRLLIVAAGIAIMALAVAAPRIGLGQTTDFIFFRWFGISRSGTLFAGVLIAAAALLVDRARLAAAARALRTTAFAVWPSIRLQAASNQGKGIADLTAIALQFAYMSAVALALLWLNRRNLMGYIDGQYLLTLMDNQRQFSPAWPVFSANPLQGLGDVWYFVNTRWIPEFAVGALFGPPYVKVVVIHYVALAEVFLAASLLSYWAFKSAGKAVAAGWLAAMVIFPLTYPSLIYNISPDGPQFAFLVVSAIALVPLLDVLGHRSAVRNLVAGALVFIVVWLQFVGVGLFSALTYPFVAIAALTSLAMRWGDRRAMLRKLIWYAIVLVLLCASGLPFIVLGFTLDTAFNLFHSELARPSFGLAQGSMLFRPAEPTGMWLAFFGLLGSAAVTFLGRGRMRQLGAAVLVTAGLILSAAVIYAGFGWSGAIPLYYEYVLWPLYPIFAVLILGALAQAALAAVPERPLSYVPRIAVWLVLPLAALTFLHGPNYRRHVDVDRPNVYPPRSTALTGFLSDKVGLAPGRSFNGRVATMTGERPNTGTTWGDAFTFDLGLVQAIGNEHRTIGLWYHNIPTILEFSHTIRPLLYDVVSRYLAEKKDGQQRNILNLRKPDTQVLRLLGVRYLVRDTANPDPGAARVQTMAVAGSDITLAVDELARPNLAVSPTRVIAQPDGESLKLLGDPAFNFENDVFLGAAAGAPLQRATDIQISIETGGVRVRAASTGQSLIVIPFQFSNCLQAVPSGGTNAPTLLRANALLTGLRFEGQLDALVKYRRGLFIGPLCGLADYRDDKAIVRASR